MISSYFEFCVDDECTVCRKKFCKLTERMTDVIDILEEIQMVRIHIQDNTDLREKKLRKLLVYSQASVRKVLTDRHGYFRRSPEGYRRH